MGRARETTVRGWGVRINTTCEKPQQRDKYWSYEQVKRRRAGDDRFDFDRVIRKFATTYFVSNLPDWCTTAELWSVFKGFGCMIDAYLPIKKSRAGKKFAFIRFKNVSDAKRLEGQLDGTWMTSSRLHVNLARFQESHPMQRRPEQVRNPNVPKKTKNHKTRNLAARQAGHARQTGMMKWVRKEQHGHDRRQHLTSEAEQQFKEGWAAIPLEVSAEDSLWLHGRLIGEVKDLETLTHITRIFQSEGLDELTIKYLGGMRMLVYCGSNIKAVKLLEQKNDWFLQWFEWITLWNGNLSQTERLIWITIKGVLVEAWNDESFSKIASKWGKVLGVDPSTSDKVCLNRGRVCILTRDFRWINEVVKVKAKSKFMEVRVIENMEFYVDFEPEATVDEQSSWVLESASDDYSASSSMEDEQVEADEEPLEALHETLELPNQYTLILEWKLRS